MALILIKDDSCLFLQQKIGNKTKVTIFTFITYLIY